MISNLKPYADRKPAEFPWLSSIPAHWQTPRIKVLLKEFDRRTGTGEEPLLSLRMREGLVNHLAAGGKHIPAEALIGCKLVEPGTVVMNRMRAASGLFGVACSAGLVSPDYATFRPALGANTAYLLYLFKVPLLAQVFRAESKGLGTGEAGFLRLYTDRFGAIHIPQPPAVEQAAIVRFLEFADQMIRRYILAKQQQIRLLDEQKQAIIHRAVSCGLDPDIRLKPSGLEWLGEVPEHWDIAPLRRY